MSIAPTDVPSDVPSANPAAEVGRAIAVSQTPGGSAGRGSARAGPARAGRLRRRGFAAKLLAHLGLILVCLGFLLPFLWMLSTSLKTNDVTQAYPPQFFPGERKDDNGLVTRDDPARYWQPGNYHRVLNDPGIREKFDFPLLVRNTLIIATLTVLGTTLSSALVAYGFAKIRFRGRGPLFALMLATMMVPFPVTMVSLFSIFRWLGDHTGVAFLGTFKPLWVPAWFGSAFNIFLLRQFFMTVPDELSEAARIDGCTDWGIFWRIILPLARPALVVVALFTFMAVWNDYMGPLVYLQRPEQYTLSLGLQAFQSQHGGTEWNLLMAAAVFVISPVLILFFLAQRTFIQGIATTGMKG